MDPHPVLVPSEGGDQPPNDIYDDKKSPQAYSIQHSQPGYVNEWQNGRTFHVVPVNTINKPYKYKLVQLCQLDYPPDVPSVTVIKPVNEVFAHAVTYQIYCPCKNSARYDEDVCS